MNYQESRSKKAATPEESFGKRIKKLRRKAGLTAAQLAEKVGSHQSRISAIENGKNAYINALDLPLYADALETTVSYLVRGGKAENLVLMNETGLSDETVDRMRANKAKGKTIFAEMVNLLSDTRLSHHELLPTSGELLLSAMYDFIHCDEKSVYKSPSDGGQYVGGLDDIYLLRIIKELQSLRSEYQQTRDQAQKDKSEDQGEEVILLEKHHLF